MSYLAGIHDLAYVFTRVGASVDAGARQDWVSLGANLAGGAGKLAWYAKGQGAFKALLEKVGKKALPTPTAIIDVTMVVVVLVDMLNGFGPPNSGAGFNSGVDKLKLVDSKLELAIPDSRDWNGTAAHAYMAQNAALQDLVREMQEIDKEIQKIVAAQGDTIFQAHRTLSILGFALVAAQGVALGLYFIPIVGPEVSMLFQVVAALAAATTVAVQESMALGQSSNRATSAEAVTAKYIALGKRAELGGSFATITVAGADEVKVGSFTAISDGLSSYVASAPPSVAALAGSAGGSVPQDRVAFVNEVASAQSFPESPATAVALAEPDTPSTPAAPEKPGQPGTPVTPVPQLAKASGQLGKMSSNLAQPMSAINQALGSVQQIVSSAQQGAGAPAAAVGAGETALADYQEAAGSELGHDEELAEEADGAAAAAGAGERAPVDATATERPAAVPADVTQRPL